MNDTAYIKGYKTAAREIAEGIANYRAAKERDIYLGHQDSRIEWDQGYEHACAAYRLGYDPSLLAKHELYGISAMDEAAVVQQLLAIIGRILPEIETLERSAAYIDEALSRLRPDPRRWTP